MSLRSFKLIAIPRGIAKHKNHWFEYCSGIELRKNRLWIHELPSPDYNYYHQIDKQNQHILAVVSGKTIGCVSIDDTYRIRQCTVHPDWENIGLGRQLVETLEDTYAKFAKFTFVNAWLESSSFYESLDFINVGDPYISRGKACQTMIKYTNHYHIPGVSSIPYVDNTDPEKRVVRLS